MQKEEIIQSLLQVAETAAVQSADRKPAIVTSTTKQPLESKKFIAMLIGVAATLATPFAIQLGLPPDKVLAALHDLIMLLMALIGGQSIADAAHAWNVPPDAKQNRQKVKGSA